MVVVVVLVVVVVVVGPNGQTPSAGGFIALKRVASLFVILLPGPKSTSFVVRPAGRILHACARAMHPCIRDDIPAHRRIGRI
jgi:hypothetical protein